MVRRGDGDPSDGGQQPRRKRDPDAGGARRGSEGAARTGASTRRGAGKPGRTRGPLGDSEPRSDRPAQVAAEIRRCVQSEIARGLNDPRVQGMVSVTDVAVTPDLAEARVRVSVMPEDRAPLTLSGLRAAAGFLRRRVMDETRIGRVPRLVFAVDESLRRETALEAAIRAARSAEGAPEEGNRESETT